MSGMVEGGVGAGIVSYGVRDCFSSIVSQLCGIHLLMPSCAFCCQLLIKEVFSTFPFPVNCQQQATDPDHSYTFPQMMLSETCQISIDKCERKQSNNNNGSNNTSGNMLLGRSRAGDATAFAIPSLKWMFDCGAMIQGWTAKVIFLTHTHSDHVHFLSHHLMKNIDMQLQQQNPKQSPPTVYLPQESLTFVKDHLKAYRAMTECGTSEAELGNSNFESLLDNCLRPLKTNQEFIIQQGGSNKFRVQTLPMDHRIPCLGYSIFRVVKKLKPEYIGLSGPQIGQLKREGVDVTAEQEEPFFCFMGDTTARVFDLNPRVLQQQNTIVVECSFLDKHSKQRAVETMHMHWDDLQPHVASHHNVMFLLTHFSLKSSTLSIRQFFRNLQSVYDNIHPMLLESEVEQQWAKCKEDGDVPRCRCRVCHVMDL
jgi:ribonuclease Z